MLTWFKRQWRQYVLVPWWKFRLESALKAGAIRYDVSLEKTLDRRVALEEARNSSLLRRQAFLDKEFARFCESKKK